MEIDSTQAPDIPSAPSTDFQHEAEVFSTRGPVRYSLIFGKLLDGRWCDATLFSSPELISVLAEVHSTVPDIMFPGDGLPNPRFTSHAQVFHQF
jgi:hypothetical protein